MAAFFLVSLENLRRGHSKKDSKGTRRTWSKMFVEVRDRGMCNQTYMFSWLRGGPGSPEASCFRFPLTPVVIVLEITGTAARQSPKTGASVWPDLFAFVPGNGAEESYNLILPVALSSFTALAVSNHLFPPLLDTSAEQMLLLMLIMRPFISRFAELQVLSKGGTH